MDDFEPEIAHIAGSTRRVRDQMTTIEEATTEMKLKELTLKRQKINILKTKEVLDRNRAVIRDAETVIITENNSLTLVIAPLLIKVLSALGEIKADIKDIKEDVEAIKDDIKGLKRGQSHLANSISFINDKTFETMPFVNGAIPDTLPRLSCIADITALTEAQVQSYLRGYGKPDNGEEWEMKRELAILHGVSRSFANTLFKASEESNEDGH